LRKIGNLDLTVGANYFKDAGYRELEQEERIRGNLSLRYKFKKVPRLTAGIAISAMHMQQADFILWQDADSGAYRQNPETYAPLAGHRFNIDPYVEYFTPGGNRHTLRTRLYSVGNATVDETKNSFSKVWYGEYRFLKKFGEDVHWTSGFSLMRNTVDAGLFNAHKGSNVAAYSQLDAHLLRRLTISTGVRWELNSLNGELFYSNPVFRAGLNYQAGKATFMRASFGQGYRFPSVAEKFADARIGGLNIFPNPELEPERGWSAEAGVKQGFSMGSWAGFVDLAVFWTDYENMIEYTFGVYPPDSLTPPTFEDVGFKALNIGTARIAGTELTVNGQGRVGPVTLILTAGYTFMDPVDPQIIKKEGRGEDEAFILKYRRRHLIKSDLEAEFWQMFAGVNLQYNSRMINVDEIFIDPLLGNQLQPGFPDYWLEHSRGYALVDLRLGWNIIPAFRISGVLRNTLNAEYLGRPGDIGPPRNFTLQLKLNF
jgi:outer membrane receptor protein involved in Fe transport